MFFSRTLSKQTIKSVLLPLGSSFFLWGCAEQVTYDFPPACPKLTVLSSASDYYTFTDNEDDLSHLITKASILGIEGNCIDDPKNAANKEKKRRNKPYVDQIDTTMSIVIQAQRGPKAQQRRYRIPYFIATIHNGQIVAKKELIAEFNFPDNINQATISSGKLFFKVPSTPQRTPDGYEFAVGFQLSPEQLAYNRSHFRPMQYIPY